MPNEFETLRFSTGKRVQRLPEPEITQADLLEYLKRAGQRICSRRSL